MGACGGNICSVRVLGTIESDHLGICIDTGNAVLTLEDPLDVVRKFASRTYTVHLKDWGLIHTETGILVKGCPLGEGIVDLPAVVDLLARNAPDPEELHLNIETAQEWILLDLFTSDFWKHHRQVTGGELECILRYAEKNHAYLSAEHRPAHLYGVPETEIFLEEEKAIRKSVRYAGDVLQLLTME